MNIAKARLAIRTAAAVLIGVSVLAAPGLTYAQHMGGGGGGGHASGGGGGGHAGGGGGGHVSAPHFGGGGVGFGHYAAAGHYGGAYGGVHYGAPHSGFVGHPGGYYGGGGVHGGYASGAAYWHGGHYWGGGYWHGGYWPHVWFRPGWAWWYPVLPIGYATFWWGGVPYYYWNNLYYTWNPGYNGYVVTDPPPAGGATGTYDDSGSPDPAAVNAAPVEAPQDFGGPAPGAAAGGPAGAAGSDIFVYPRNGQTDQQTATDRYECHTWSVGQTGFDPTRSAQSGTGTGADYRRAMVACLDARGYSAR